MRNVKVKFIVYRVVIALLFVFIAAVVILGYLVAGENRYGEICDGWGRLLDDVPDTVSPVLPQWAGMVWFCFDCAGVALSVTAIGRLFRRMKSYVTNEEDDWEL